MPDTYVRWKKKKCERCSARKKLLVHHRDHNHKNHDPKNLETLCQKCHAKEHRRGLYRRDFSDKHRKSKCEICGSTRTLQVCHMDGDRKNKRLDNIQTRCKNCIQNIRLSLKQFPRICKWCDIPFDARRPTIDYCCRSHAALGGKPRK